MADRDRTTSTSSSTTSGSDAAGAASAANADLHRLNDLRDFDVADGYPDVRGWTVKTPDGQTLGKVDDLIVSMREMRVRYVDVDVDRGLRTAFADAATPGQDEELGHALVPIGVAHLDAANDDIVVRGLGSDLSAYPRYAGREIAPGYEGAIRTRFAGGIAATTGVAAEIGTASATTPSEFYAHEHFDDRGALEAYRARRTGGSPSGVADREVDLGDAVLADRAGTGPASDLAAGTADVDGTTGDPARRTLNGLGDDLDDRDPDFGTDLEARDRAAR